MKLNEQRLIYKISSKDLKKSKWKMEITLDRALQDNPDMVVSIGESQLIRWIDDLRGVNNANKEIKQIKKKNAKIRNSAETSKTKKRLTALYNQLYQLKFLPDLVAVVFPSNKRSKDYDTANKGFYINGVKYRRLLGTSGGIKKCTIFYIAEDLHGELMRKIENGRNPDKELVAAKLEAYRALTCSGSVPIPKPNGVIVVKDCITKFKENVIVIRDSDKSDEPILSHEKDYLIEHNNSDGFGLMLPSYAARINEFLTGDSNPLSGMVIRYSFTKGMLVSFDFVEFAEKIANNFIINDVWGNPHDIRSAEVILTESQLKLWDSYSSWEDYEKNCFVNGYDFAVTKTCPMELENVHTTNYQFLQPYDFTKQEIAALCKPTLDEIKDIMNFDYRKAIVYLGGVNPDFNKIDDMACKALMINPDLINDPYVMARIKANIKKQIERAERGKLKINANYAMIVGDPYALAESMFNLPAIGLLTKGEVYHKYWIDKGADEISCFRAPMSVANNIRKLKLNQSEQAAHWFRYIKTVCVLNAWDSTFEAENGADADGDTFYCTDNPLIVNKTAILSTIISVQNKAPKIKPKEQDIISANKLAFNDKIGAITNTVTSMYDVRAMFPKDSQYYKELTYRIMCGQHFQQGQIDKAKGAIVKEMPECWKQLKPDEEYSDLQKIIAADKRPYFFRYVYQDDNKTFQKHNNNMRDSALKMCGIEFDELINSDKPEAKQILQDYFKLSPLSDNGCTVNRIAHHIENEMADFDETIKNNDFDYSILKCKNVEYSKQKYNLIKQIYNDYIADVAAFIRGLKYKNITKEEREEHKGILLDSFRRRCALVCPINEELTNIVIDLVYSEKKSKSFAWQICGEQIIENLLKSNDYKINVPELADNGEFEFNGSNFRMNESSVKNNENKFDFE